jgi:hypothetical protein
MTTGGTGDDSSDDLRQVEIRKHCIRVLDGTKLKLWCVYTDAQATVERSPGGNRGHPLCGRLALSGGPPPDWPLVADLLIEVMKIKTALYRMCLDSGYFALNQRTEVAMEQANEFTISDLLRNEPSACRFAANGDAVQAA